METAWLLTTPGKRNSCESMETGRIEYQLDRPRDDNDLDFLYSLWNFDLFPLSTFFRCTIRMLTVAPCLWWQKLLFSRHWWREGVMSESL